MDIFLINKKGYPNIVIPLIGGILSDIFGDRILLIYGTIVILIGWLISCLGMVKVSYFIFMAGQVVQAFAISILNEMSSIIPARWFKE